jgi:hypothetical protein
MPTDTASSQLPNPDELASVLLGAAGQMTPSTDLVKVIALWPTLNVSVEDLDGSGYLADLGEAGGEIIVRSADSAPRRRYTVAHELGHWLLGLDPASRGDCSGSRDSRIERWCDRFAAAVLMPATWIHHEVATFEEGSVARKILTMPGRYRVSRSAMFLRISEVTDISLVVGWPTKTKLNLSEYWSVSASPRVKCEVGSVIRDREVDDGAVAGVQSASVEMIKLSSPRGFVVAVR